jgi:hypothetical protein
MTRGQASGDPVASFPWIVLAAGLICIAVAVYRLATGTVNYLEFGALALGLFAIAVCVVLKWPTGKGR